MAVTIGNDTISGLTAGGIPSGIVTAATLDSNARRWKNAAATSNSSSGGGGDTGWLNHLSVGFTTTEANSTCMVRFDTSHGYEAGAGNCTGYFALTGATTQNGGEFQFCKQGYSSNFAFGSHSMQWVFTGLNVGAHTMYVYNRNWNATAYINYHAPGRGVQSYLQVWYL